MDRKRQFIILGSLFLVFVFYFVYTANAATFNGISFSTMNADAAFNQTFVVSAWGSNLSDGDNVCTGQFNATVTTAGVYDNVTGAIVPCPTFGCGPRPAAAATAAPFPVSITTQATYNTMVANLFNTVFFTTAQAPHIFGPNTLYGQYYRLSAGSQSNVGGPASFSNGLFCHGTASVVSNSTSQTSIPLTTALHTFTPPLGQQLISTSYSVDACGMFVRTTENDGPTKDSVYTSSLTSAGNSTATLNITVYQGINFTMAGSPGIVNAPVLSGPFTITVPISNNGDLDANITSVTLSPGSFPVNGFSPNNISAGQTVTMTINSTAPATPGVYPLNISITGTPLNPPPMIGPCGNSSILTTTNVANASNGSSTTVIVGPSTVGPLSISLTATPPSIIREQITDGQVVNETLVGRITRPGDYNIVGSINMNATFNEYHPTDGWKVVRYVLFNGMSCTNELPAKHCDLPGLSGCTTRITDIVSSANGEEVNFSVVQPLTLISGKESSCSAWDDRIYRVDLSVYDILGDATQTRSTYFGIYSLTCADRAS